MADDINQYIRANFDYLLPIMDDIVLYTVFDYQDCFEKKINKASLACLRTEDIILDTMVDTKRDTVWNKHMYNIVSYMFDQYTLKVFYNTMELSIHYIPTCWNTTRIGRKEIFSIHR